MATKQEVVQQVKDWKTSYSTSLDAALAQVAKVKSDAQTALDKILADALIEPVVIPPPPPPQRVGILAPTYFYPGGTTGLGYWNSIIAAASKIPMIAIPNPASGPGVTANPDYVSIIAKCKAAGVKMCGYVSTRYGLRPMAEIQADVLKWKTLYGVIHIFLDEQSNKLADVPFYTTLIAWIKQTNPDAFVVTNPGTACVQEYYTVAKSDLILISERADTVLTLPAWAQAAPDKYFAAMIHTADQTEMRAAVANAKAYGLGYLYATNDVFNNPWDTLPPYWQDMVDRLAAIV